jgi:outer membrane protein assembly factor BamB
MLTRALLPFIVIGIAHAKDWPQWRGPANDGISTDAMSAAPSLKEVWKAEIGIGFSSIAVGGGRAFTMGHDGDAKESVYAFDAKTGKELWRHTYEADLGNHYFEGGPLSTPTIDGDEVYTLSKWGDLFCFDAASGKVVWQKNLAKDLTIDAPEWGFAGSPRITGKHLYVNVGSRGAKLSKAEGKIVWSSDAEPASGYSTPQLATVSGKEQLILANTKAYLGIDPASGTELWSIDWPTRYGVNAADAIVSGTTLFISSGYGKGCAAYDLGSAEPKQLYTHRLFKAQMNPPVLIDGHLYGIDDNENAKTSLKCVELATGSVKWTQPILGLGAVCAARDQLIVLSGKGELSIGKASPQSFEPTQTSQLMGGKCWTVPTLANGLLYARNAAGSLICVSAE